MQKLFGIFLGVIVGMAVAIGIFFKIHTQPNLLNSTMPQTVDINSQLSQPDQEVERVVGIPAILSIPAIKVNAPVESVGLDSSGNMDVPKLPSDVAWYNLGFKPGEDGSGVIAGHLNDIHARPAVFWNLSKLKPGDRIITTDSKGSNYVFIVSKVVSYPVDQFPLQDVFASSGRPGLNLITCDGIYKRSTGGYTNRIVVHSYLQGS